MKINVKDNISPWIILDSFIIQMTLFKILLCKNTWAQVFCSLMILTWIMEGGVEELYQSRET